MAIDMLKTNPKKSGISPDRETFAFNAYFNAFLQKSIIFYFNPAKKYENGLPFFQDT